MRFRETVAVLIAGLIIRWPAEELLGIYRFSASNITNISMAVQYIFILTACVGLMHRTSEQSCFLLSKLPNTKLVVLAIAFGTALLLTTLGINSLVVWCFAQFDPKFAYDFWGFHQQRYYANIDTPEFLILIIAQILLAAVAEEVLFRGMMFRSLQTIGSVRAAVIVSIVFAVLHFGKGMTGAFGFSYILCFLYKKHGVIWAPIIAHATYNSLSYVASYKYEFHFQRSMNQIGHLSDWIPELSMSLCSVMFIVFVLKTVKTDHFVNLPVKQTLHK